MTIEFLKMKEHIYKKRRPTEEYVQLLNENGYVINEIYQDMFEYRFTNGSALMSHFLITLSFLESWKGLLPDNRTEEIFEEVEKRLNKTAEENGFIKLTIPFVLIDGRKK